MGNPQQRIHRDRFDPAFKGTQVNRMKIGLFGKPLLAEPRPLATNADGLTEKAAMFGNVRHPQMGT